MTAIQMLHALTPLGALRPRSSNTPSIEWVSQPHTHHHRAASTKRVAMISVAACVLVTCVLGCPSLGGVILSNHIKVIRRRHNHNNEMINFVPSTYMSSLWLHIEVISSMVDGRDGHNEVISSMVDGHNRDYVHRSQGAFNPCGERYCSCRLTGRAGMLPVHRSQDSGQHLRTHRAIGRQHI